MTPGLDQTGLIQANAKYVEIRERLHLRVLGNFTHRDQAHLLVYFTWQKARMAMSRQNISQELKNFIKEQIQSVFSLEVLLLLHREHSRSFTSEEIANELGIEIDVVQQLAELISVNLLATTSAGITKYYYAPTNRELASLVDQLVVAYSKKRVPILSLILAEHPDKIRVFAEAFRLIGNH